MSTLINGRSPEEVRRYDIFKAIIAAILFILLLLSYRSCARTGQPMIDAIDGNVTAGETVELTGTGTPGDTVQLMVNGEAVGTATVDADGNWSLPVTFGEADDYQIVANAINGDGSIKASSAALALAVGGAAFALPTLNLPAGQLNSGLVPLSGMGEPGQTVQVMVDGKAVGTAVVGPDGKWSLPVLLNDPGEHEIVVNALDADGNILTASAPYAIGLGALAAGLALPNLDGWDWGSGELPALSGTGNPGEKIDILDADGNVIGSTVVGPDGTWSMPFDQLGLSGPGDYNLSMKKYDADGNLLGSADLPSWNISSGAWAAGAGLAAGGAMAGLNMPDLDGWDWGSGKLPALSGTGNPGETIEILDADGNVIGTTVVGPDGTWSMPFDQLGLSGPGDYNFAVNKYDADGKLLSSAKMPGWNISSGAWAAGAGLAAGGAMAGLNLPDLDGWDWGSGKLPALSGTGNPGETIEILDADGNVIGTTVVGPDGTWSMPFDQLGLSGPGDYNFAMNKYDADGKLLSSAQLPGWNVSAAAWDAGSAIAAGGTGGAMAEPAVMLPAGGLFAGEQMLSGTGEPGSTVQVYLNGALVGTAVVGEDGNWSLPVTVEDGAGNQMIEVRAVDADGNTLASSGEQAVGISAAVMLESPVSGANLDGSEMMLSGRARPGATVEILDGDRVVGTAVAGKDGRWSYNYKPDQAGAHSLSARLAGETGTATAPAMVTLAALSDTGTDGSSDNSAGSGTGTGAGNGAGTAAIPAGCGEPGEDLGATYVVAPCEWLAKIARRIDVPVHVLMNMNPEVWDPNLIFPGQILNVPVPEERGKDGEPC